MFKKIDNSPMFFLNGLYVGVKKFSQNSLQIKYQLALFIALFILYSLLSNNTKIIELIDVKLF